MAVTAQVPEPQMVNTIDALWSLIQSQPKKVRAALTKRIIQQDVEAEAMRQRLMVKESLTYALRDVKEARQSGRKLKTAEEFLAELEAE